MANQFKQAIIEALKDHVDVKPHMIETPPAPPMGDSAVPCFPFAKELKKSPQEIAAGLAQLNMPDELIAAVKNTGPYLNFFVNKSKFAQKTLTSISKDYGSQKNKKEKVMIEYSQVNTHKAFHVGHLRGTILGASIIKIRKFCGYKTIAANYQGDIGAHVAKVIWYLSKNNPEHPSEHKGRWLGDIYQKANQAINEDNKDEVSEVLQKLEVGDHQLTALWKKTRKWSLDDFEYFYKVIGVQFDHYFFESEYEKPGKKIVNELLEKGVAEKSQGAIIIDLEDKKLAKLILLKSDGTALYSTKDLALANDKFKKYKIDVSVYVVGAEQKFYFQQVFATLKKMGFKQAENCVHIPYSLVNLKGGKISSREGELIFAEQLVEEVIEEAKNAILSRHKNLSQKEIGTRANKIGLSALKFSFLNQDNNKEIIFDKKTSLSFEGETGPYVQYTYARISSILRKAGKSKPGKWSDVNDKEHLIIRMLERFPMVIDDSCRNYRPSVICRYLLDLCQLFNQYYHDTPILKADENLKNCRLQLISKVKQVLSTGLALLGIEVLEEM